MFDFAADPSLYAFRSGAMFFGEHRGQRLGITSKRHAITIAGARSGKGVAVINTNLRTWPHNVMVIDPKGEAASVSWEARAAMGQAVHVLDPFKRAKIPARIRATFNPLEALDPESDTIREDIVSIADGTIMRSGDEESVYWDNGAMRLLAGLIAYVLAELPPVDHTLLSVRDILTDQREGGLFGQAVDTMAAAPGDGLAQVMRAGASAAFAKESDYFISNATAHTDWLDSKVMRDTLSSSSFSMNDLKLGKVSIFVALPFKYLPQQQHGRFLRLMVRCGIGAMMELTPDGEDLGERCLFILDEFFSLGFMSEIATAVGGLPSYGVHLWPFLQDYDQLLKLYGREGAGTFFGSSDLHQFFGNTDEPTLDLISKKLGAFTVDDLPNEPRKEDEYWVRRAHETMAERDKEEKRWFPNIGKKAALSSSAADSMRIGEQEYRERLARFNTDASRILGKPRLTPEQVASLVRLADGGTVADKQIAFVHGNRPVICDLSPYFTWKDEQSQSALVLPTAAPAASVQKKRAVYESLMGEGFIVAEHLKGQAGTWRATCRREGCRMVLYGTSSREWEYFDRSKDHCCRRCGECNAVSDVYFWDASKEDYVRISELPLTARLKAKVRL